jgi:hypothetical protein
MLNRFHLEELRAAKRHVMQGREIIAQVKARGQRLREQGRSPSPHSEKLLEQLEITQRLFEGHVALIKRELRDG